MHHRKETEEEYTRKKEREVIIHKMRSVRDLMAPYLDNDF
jgi:hypothetical protein